MAEKKFFVSPEDLQAAYQQFGSALKVAKHYGVSKKLVLNYMKRYGIGRKQRASLEQRRKEIQELSDQGLMTKDIAEILGLSYEQINKHISRNGIPIKRYHKGYTTNSAGYVFVKQPDHPNANSKGYIREHVLLMTEKIGRALKIGECVHHIDGNKSNNNIANLILMLDCDHRSLHSRQPRKRRS